MVCPGCLASYAKVLATLGVGIAFTETEHVALLVVCIALSLVVGVREARLTRRWAPLAVNVAGCGALVVAHARSDSSSISWLGVVLILGGAVWSHRLRFARRSHVHHAKHAAALKLESTSSA